MFDKAAININDLTLFAKVIEYGTFTAAADYLNLPKSTLSRRISYLENQLGERLIIRNTRRINITEFGQAVLDHVYVIEREAQEINDLATYRQITPTGRLKVSLPPNFTDFIKKDFFQCFINKYPDVHLDLDFSPRRVDIVAERYDLAVRMASSLPDDTLLVARPLKKLSGGLYASPKYLEKHGKPKLPDDLEKHVGIHLTNSLGEIQPWCLTDGKSTWRGTPPGPVSVNSVEMVRLLAIQDIGIISITSTLVEEYVNQGKLIRLLENWELPTVSMWGITLGRKLLPTKIKVFLDELTEALL